VHEALEAELLDEERAGDCARAREEGQDGSRIGPRRRERNAP